MAYGGPRAATDLFAPVLLASQLHLAHAAGADGLAQDPLARLGGNGGARSCLLGSGRVLVLVRCWYNRRRRWRWRGLLVPLR